MKKQLYLAVALAVALFASCNNDKKKENSDDGNAVVVEKAQVELTQEQRLASRVDSLNIIWISPTSQSTRELTPNERSTQRRHIVVDKSNLKNKFSTDDNFIKIQIPVTTDNMRVVGATNVSAFENAMVVHIDGNNGSTTNGLSITHMLEVTFTLKDLFTARQESKLLNDRKILVKMLHDDNLKIADLMTDCLNNCISQVDRNYVDFDCKCKDQVVKALKDIDITIDPKEVDGGILHGGR